MAQDVLLALGVLLSTASQLRPANLPVGPGEVCLAIWLFLMLVRETSRLGPPLTAPVTRMLTFWAVFAFAQSLGTVVGSATELDRDPDSLLHDCIAYVLLAGISCLSVVEPNPAPRLRRVAWLLVAFGAVALAIQVADAWGLYDVPMINPWYWDRFCGWSENPNQLALLSVGLGLLSLHLADSATRPAGQLGGILCAVVPAYVGLISGSDTFKLVLLFAGPFYVGLKMRAWLLLPGREVTFRFAAVWIAIFALPLVVAAVVPFGPWIVDQTEEAAEGIYWCDWNRWYPLSGPTEPRWYCGSTLAGGYLLSAPDHYEGDNDQGGVRVELWWEAVDRGVESWMLGMGPGAHLAPPPWKTLPSPNFEAHNTYLDLLTQGGLLAVASFVWLLATAFLATFTARQAGLSALLFGFGLFTMFHLIVRHPVFWFSTALCLVAEPAGLPRSRALLAATGPRYDGILGGRLARTWRPAATGPKSVTHPS